MSYQLSGHVLAQSSWNIKLTIPSPQRPKSMEYWFADSCLMDLSAAPTVAQIVKNLPAIEQTQVQSLGWKDLLEKSMATNPVFLPREFHGVRSLAGYSQWGHKELNMTEWLTLSLFTRGIHFLALLACPMHKIGRFQWLVRVPRRCVVPKQNGTGVRI